MRILHLIERLSLGGASRGLITLAKYSARSGEMQHRAWSLLAPDRQALDLARGAGLTVAGPGNDETLDREIGAADIVQIHFWNNPRLYEALHRDWPAARVVCWCHVAGDRGAQILTPALAGFPDVMVATAPLTTALPLWREVPAGVTTAMIPTAADFERLDAMVARPHPRFTVGYIGTLDFMKMHPDFVALHAAIDVPDLRVVVCGSGPDAPQLARQAAQLGCAGRFEFRGPVESIADALAEFDVFGYPLCPETYATAELAVQEAMGAGIPPVVLDQGSPARMIRSGRTGLVVAGAKAYAQAIERLHRDPAFRSELGSAAARHARDFFGADRMVDSFHELYRRMAASPKRTRRLGPPWPAQASSSLSGAGRFIASLGPEAGPFAVSLRADPETARSAAVSAAEAEIAASPPRLANGGAGGILHYRLHYPSDPHLRFWAGLVFQHQGRPALAAVEFHHATTLGLDPSRVRRHSIDATLHQRHSAG